MNWPTRYLKDSDYNYICKSWVMSLRGQFPYSEMSKEAIAKYAARTRALLSVSKVKVACDPQDEDVIYGFICYEDDLYLGRKLPTLHYVWTRRPVRKNGIASQLMESAFGTLQPRLYYTHHTRMLTNAKLKEKWNLSEFDPYLIEGALFRDAKQIDARAIYWSKIPGQVDAPAGASL